MAWCLVKHRDNFTFYFYPAAWSLLGNMRITHGARADEYDAREKHAHMLRKMTPETPFYQI
jgi:hypothetical protein